MSDATHIIDYATSIGYDKCGIVNTFVMKDYSKKLRDRIEKFPETREKSEWLFQFADLEQQFPWANSIIVCASWYGDYYIPKNVEGHIAKYYLTDGRRDFNSREYIRSIQFEKFLKSKHIRFVSDREFGVTALRWVAMKAGIGVIRKNNFFYTEKGSWLHLEAFLVDSKIEHIYNNNIKKCPENCFLCIKSCPTKSLSEPYMMCRNSCISCLTTWDGWDLTTNPYNYNMGSWIFGCDVCQDVCPFNKNSWTQCEKFPGLDELCNNLSLEQIVLANYSFLKDTVQPKLWYIPEDKLWRYKTNALNAMLNDFKPEYLDSINCACTDKFEEVRKQARWVLSKLNKKI